MNKMKILVTGASGFVGMHLCEKLLSQGHIVFALVRSPSKMTLTHPHLSIIKGDLNLAKLSWIEQLPTELDACIHTAGIVHSYNTDSFFQVNTEGTKFLINGLKNKYHHFKFMLISSLAAAGPSLLGELKDETQIPFPVSDYGRSKNLAEELLKTIAPKEWTTSIIRPPMVIGPGDLAVLDIFKMVRDGFILLPGLDSKSKQYSFVCVYDLVETITKLIESDHSFLLFSAYPQVVTFEELIIEIKTQLKKKWIIYLPLPLFIVRLFSYFLALIHSFYPHQLRLTPDKIFELVAPAWTCNGQLASQKLSQVYQYNLTATINLTLKDYQKRRWL